MAAAQTTTNKRHSELKRSSGCNPTSPHNLSDAGADGQVLAMVSRVGMGLPAPDLDLV
jgi:hypothetical protein